MTILEFFEGHWVLAEFDFNLLFGISLDLDLVFDRLVIVLFRSPIGVSDHVWVRVLTQVAEAVTRAKGLDSAQGCTGGEGAWREAPSPSCCDLLLLAKCYLRDFGGWEVWVFFKWGQGLVRLRDLWYLFETCVFHLRHWQSRVLTGLGDHWERRCRAHEWRQLELWGTLHLIY
jgi:hypothetical protein